MIGSRVRITRGIVSPAQIFCGDIAASFGSPPALRPELQGTTASVK